MLDPQALLKKHAEAAAPSHAPIVFVFR